MPRKEGHVLLFDLEIEKKTRRNNRKNKRHKHIAKLQQQQKENTTNSASVFKLPRAPCKKECSKGEY